MKSIQVKESPLEVNVKYLYVMYSQSTFGISNLEEFHERIKKIVPEGTKIYGCLTVDDDKSHHYHVLFGFPSKTHWRDARGRLQIDGDTQKIDIKKIENRQNPRNFLGEMTERIEKAVNPVLEGYTEPSKYFFGERFVQVDINFKENMREALSYKPNFDVQPWVETAEMTRWKIENFDNNRKGRCTSIVIIGKPKSGKTEWGLQACGRNPIEMSNHWNIDSYSARASHIVVNDCNPASFGYHGHYYWREVLGCQTRFDASDKYRETRTLEWGIPAVWTCTPDMDPRKDPVVAKYIEQSGCIVVELGENNLY